MIGVGGGGRAAGNVKDLPAHLDKVRPVYTFYFLTITQEAEVVTSASQKSKPRVQIGKLCLGLCSYHETEVGP